MSNGDGASRAPVDPTKETYARALPNPEPEHTEVHDKGNRLIELLQDVVVILLTVTLLVLALVFLWRVWQELLGTRDLLRAISDIIYVVITVELYRLSVHYLKYHKVDLNTLVEVGVSAIIQKVILVGVESFTMEQLIGISLVLAALGAIRWVHMREERRYGQTLNSADAEAVADPAPIARENQEDRHVVDSTGDWKPTR